MKCELIVALDFQTRGEAEPILKALGGLPIIYKVGSEIFTAEGPSFVRELKERGHRVFLDLKFHDIPNTVAGAVASAAQLGVDFVSAHLSGGPVMFTAIGERVPSGLIILGISVLTSFDDRSWSEVMHASTGFATVQPSASALGLIRAGVKWGVNGVVCSPQELKLVRAEFPTLYCVTPGIRPDGSARGDQVRVMTPREAALAGASAIVVGRPITQASNPRSITEEILRDLDHVSLHS